jgi:hypothetical protein
MTPDRTAAVILAAWRQQGWQVRPELADAAIKDMVATGGRYCDFEQRAADVWRLVEWRRNYEIPGTDRDVADAFLCADPADAFGAGLYRALVVIPYANEELIDAMFAAGLYRALSFLKADVRAEVGRELLETHHAPLVAAAE